MRMSGYLMIIKTRPRVESWVLTTGGADTEGPFSPGLSVPFSRLLLFFRLRLHQDQDSFDDFVETLSLLDSVMAVTTSERISSGGSDIDLACKRRCSSTCTVVESAPGV